VRLWSRWDNPLIIFSMNERCRGKLVVVSGPSGAGKTSICDELLKRIPNSRWSVSVTTRPRRGHEVDGEAYQFVTREEFDRMVAHDELLEHAEYLGERYGTPRRPVEDAVAAGEIVIMEIEVQGGSQVAQRVPESIRIFILPPTMETLQARLQGRQTETEALQRKRLAEADGEIGFARSSGCYQYFITNDILKDSVDQVIQIIEQETKTA
jgi:guanylate kinase